MPKQGTADPLASYLPIFHENNACHSNLKFADHSRLKFDNFSTFPGRIVFILGSAVVPARFDRFRPPTWALSLLLCQCPCGQVRRGAHSISRAPVGGDLPNQENKTCATD